MKPDAWMPLYCADLTISTQQLSPAAHGSYMRLLVKMWVEDAALPDDDDQLRRIAGCDPQDWARIKGAIAPLFVRGGGTWTQKRLTAEYSKAVELHESRCERTKAARDAKTRSVTSSVTGSVTTPVTEVQPQPQPQPPLQPPFSEFNSLGAQKLDSKKPAYKRKLEKAAMQRMKAAIGATGAVNWGGLWRKRFREDPDKWHRVMADLESTMKEEVIDNPGGYADDLWKRFN